MIEILTGINTGVSILKGVLEVWDHFKSKRTVGLAYQVTQIVEQHAINQNAQQFAKTLQVEANKNLPPNDAADLISDVKYSWVLEYLRMRLEENQKWNPMLKPMFLLVMEKLPTLGGLITGRYIMGFVSGPKTAQGVDEEFERWKSWMASQSGHPIGLLVYVYDNLSSKSPDHIVGKKGSKLLKYSAIGGYIDLSQMKLEVHRGLMEKDKNIPTFWEAETRNVLKELHAYYLRIGGYFE